MGIFPSWINPAPVTYPIVVYPTSAIVKLNYTNLPPNITDADYENIESVNNNIHGVTEVTYG